MTSYRDFKSRIDFKATFDIKNQKVSYLEKCFQSVVSRMPNTYGDSEKRLFFNAIFRSLDNWRPKDDSAERKPAASQSPDPVSALASQSQLISSSSALLADHSLADQSSLNNNNNTNIINNSNNNMMMMTSMGMMHLPVEMDQSAPALDSSQDSAPAAASTHPL